MTDLPDITARPLYTALTAAGASLALRWGVAVDPLADVRLRIEGVTLTEEQRELVTTHKWVLIALVLRERLTRGAEHLRQYELRGALSETYWTKLRQFEDILATYALVIRRGQRLEQGALL